MQLMKFTFFFAFAVIRALEDWQKLNDQESEEKPEAKQEAPMEAKAERETPEREKAEAKEANEAVEGECRSREKEEGIQS